MAANDRNDANWQGFNGNNLDVVLDLGKLVQIKSVSCNFLSNNNWWIFLPKAFNVMVSEDGINYQTIGESGFDATFELKESVLKTVTFKTHGMVRFIKAVAINQGICPPWHKSAGDKCMLFVDEILVK